MHYLSSLKQSNGKANALLPSDPYTRARHLLAGQRHSETITPGFYRYLQAQDAEKQVQYGQYVTLIRTRHSANRKMDSEYVEALEAFEKEMDPEGSFFFGNELGWVDILIAPCKHTLPEEEESLSADGGL